MHNKAKHSQSGQKEKKEREGTLLEHNGVKRIKAVSFNGTNDVAVGGASHAVFFKNQASTMAMSWPVTKLWRQQPHTWCSFKTSLVSLLLPAMKKKRQTAWRTECRSDKLANTQNKRRNGQTAKMMRVRIKLTRR